MNTVRILLAVFLFFCLVTSSEAKGVNTNNEAAETKISVSRHACPDAIQIACVGIIEEKERKGQTKLDIG